MCVLLASSVLVVSDHMVQYNENQHDGAHTRAIAVDLVFHLLAMAIEIYKYTTTYLLLAFRLVAKNAGMDGVLAITRRNVIVNLRLLFKSF